MDDFHLGLRTNSNTLIVAVHPKCPCTRATVAELAKVLGRSKTKTELAALIYTPAGATTEWSRTATVEGLSALGFRVIKDKEGHIAHRLGAETSGHVLLYRKDGALLFTGGITASRGHQGDNAAEDRLMELLGGNQKSAVARSSVYGCALNDRTKGGT